MTPEFSPRALILTALCTAVLAGSAAASDVEGMRAKFREMDRNGDRSLQFSEIQAARAAIFDLMDSDADGVLDAGELEAVRAVAQSKKSARQGGLLGEANLGQRAKQMDKNGDGKIARGEFVSYLPERLIAADRDSNGALSLRELRSLKRARDTTATP